MLLGILLTSPTSAFCTDRINEYPYISLIIMLYTCMCMSEVSVDHVCPGIANTHPYQSIATFMLDPVHKSS